VKKKRGDRHAIPSCWERRVLKTPERNNHFPKRTKKEEKRFWEEGRRKESQISSVRKKKSSPASGLYGHLSFLEKGRGLETIDGTKERRRGQRLVLEKNGRGEG